MILLIYFLTHFSLAKAEDCKTIASYKDFYFCTLQKHPNFEISKLKTNEGEALVDKASQFENPEIGLKSVSGSYAGENVGSTELTVNLSMSQIWRRIPVKKMAESEKKLKEIESKEILLSVKKTLIRDLYRFRQIDDELELLRETLTAFEAVKRQYKNLLAKKPEQEITLSLVELANGDYELKRNRLMTEKSEILSKLKGIWGTDFEIKKIFLPPSKKQWPEISDKISVTSSFEIQKISAEAEKAQAELGLAQSESWPNVTIGPVIERTTDGAKQFYSYGVNATISLPVLTINGGSRKLANARVQQAKLFSDYAIKKSHMEKEILLQRYRSSIESLKKASSRDEIAKKHARVDNLFKQGLAPGSLVIEAHRQINEFTVSQHELENSAIESYLEIKALSGDDIEEIFK